MTAGESKVGEHAMPAAEVPESEATKATASGVERTRSPLLLEGIGQRFGLLIAWGIIVLIFSILRPDEFATSANFQTIFSSQAVLVILAIASIAPLIAGELDLSFAGVFGLSIVIVGTLNVDEGWPIGIAILVALLVGVAVGVVNAVVVVVVGVDSIVGTLGMGTLLGGIALGLNPIPIAGVSADLVDVVRHRFLGLQVSFYIALALCVLVWFIFEHTPTGRRLYFVGAGRSVARLSGIRVDRMRAGAFVTTAFLSAFAGIMFSGLVGASDSTIGPTFLLPALAAVFLGATAITPGRFNVWGTFIAVYFLVCGITGLELVGLSGWIVQVFYGGSLVVAVVMSRLLGMRLSGLREQR
jgi:ribose transport system permease protein